jgi:alkylhydroperoxidase family enzyme
MQTLDPYAVSPKEMQELISLHAFLDSSGLEEGETTERLVALGAWRSASLFTEKERVALEWSEAVTFLSRSRVPDGFYTAMRQWFTDIEIVKLTMIIAATTAWNRMEMSFPRSYSEAE